MEVIHKATAEAAGPNPLVFVMSDETVDRYGDVIDQAGWRLANFRKNPIALFGHRSDEPIGRWKNVRVEGGKLLGELDMLPLGQSARVDELRAFVAAGMLRAVSVGFYPADAEPISGSAKGGMRYKAAELVECSLVSIPANPNALQVAKALNLSDDAKSLIFGKSADEISRIERDGPSGEPAPPHLVQRTASMTMTISERIETAQSNLVQLQDQLTTHLAGDNPDAATTDDLSDKIEKSNASISALKRAEAALASRAAPAEAQPQQRQAEPAAQRRTFAAAAKKSEPKDLIIRSAVVHALSRIERRPLEDVLLARYGADENLKSMLEVTCKSASAPATTTTSGWAAELVQTATLDLIESLVANSIYPILRERGGKFTFGRNGIVSVPARAPTPSVAGSFVGQGAPIPVRQAGFTATTLTPKKMAVITTFTREIAAKSTPDIEQTLRQAIQEDTGVAIDTVLLDANAATTIRPAGLRNGVTGVTATAGGGFAAAVADLKALVTALITGSNGNVRQPVWIMNPIQKLSLSLTQNAGGDFPFAADLQQGTLLGYPVAESATVPAGTVMLIDAADFFTSTGDEPVFDVSDQATLHMEDTTPLQISAVGTPNTVAAPVRSMFQTDSLALRMILDMNWTMRRSGMVAFVASVTW